MTVQLCRQRSQITTPSLSPPTALSLFLPLFGAPESSDQGALLHSQELSCYFTHHLWESTTAVNSQGCPRRVLPWELTTTGSQTLLTAKTGCNSGFQVAEPQIVGSSPPTSRTAPCIGALPSLGQAHKSCPREISCPDSLEHSGKSKNILEALQLSPHCVRFPHNSLSAARAGDQPVCAKAGLFHQSKPSLRKVATGARVLRSRQIRRDSPARKIYLHDTFCTRCRAWHTPIAAFLLFKGPALQTLNFTCVSRVPLKHNGATHANNIESV